MRKEFSTAIERLAKADEKIIFLTGDLGYNALENLQETMGDRFINTGVAEQNMVGMAAGLAYKGYKVFCYSIAPFIVYRCWEQFRNDVCLHNLPVFLVGNGGGYGYGIMGSSHHAIEDLAGLSSLQNVKCWVPAFADEVEICADRLVAENRPAYLRLGYGLNTPSFVSESKSVRVLQHISNANGTILALGPVANNVFKALADANLTTQFNVITALTLPFITEDSIFKLIQEAENLVIVEEHVSIGGLAQQISVQLLEREIHLKKFVSLRAEGYPNGTYGSQGFHQEQSGLDVKNIIKVLQSIL